MNSKRNYLHFVGILPTVLALIYSVISIAFRITIILNLIYFIDYFCSISYEYLHFIYLYIYIFIFKMDKNLLIYFPSLF